MTFLRKMLPSTGALFVFEAAARHGSFTHAAAEMNVTQPAVSKTLAQLERHLGVKLFERVADGVVLSEAGVLLYRRIKGGFRGIEDALREIDVRRTGRETITLSLSTAFTTHWLMPRIDKLQEAFPAVDFRFQLIPGAIRGPVDEVDLGMRFVDGPDLDHEAVFLMRELMLPVCSTGYQTKRDRTHDDIFINLSESSPSWVDRMDAPAADWPGRRAFLHFSDYAIVLQAALLGQGVALGWITVASHWLRVGDLIPASRHLIRTERRCQLVWLRARPLRASAAAVRDWIVAELRGDLATIDALYPDLGLAEASGVPGLIT